MDSCNSGSLQSSSNGEEELDSRTDSISAFFNSSSSSSLSHHPPPPITSHHHNPSSSSSSSSFFDSISSYLDAFPRSPPSDTNPLNPNVAWTKSLRPSPPSQNPNNNDTTSLIGSSSSLSNPPAAMAIAPQAPRGGKKRSRASRRAPTTVLTTDMTNFRAMVQEFTGIPTPPFAASSLPFSRPRLDLLHATPLPPYLLRPFAHKAHAQPPLFNPIPSSSVHDPIPSSIISRNTNANICITTTTTTTTTSTSADDHTSHLGLSCNQDQEQGLLNIGSPMFNFQSLLQPPVIANYNSSSMPAFGERPQAPAEYGMANLGHAASLERMDMRGRSNDPSVWADVSGSNGDRAQLRPVIRSTSAARGGGGGGGGGGGVVGSWIIPSE